MASPVWCLSATAVQITQIMEPKYLTKSDVQLKLNISRTKNDKRVLLKALES